jgi:glutamate formiminotransferase
VGATLLPSYEGVLLASHRSHLWHPHLVNLTHPALPAHPSHPVSPIPVIECIPNVSEVQRPEVVELLTAAIRGTEGVRLLDAQSDATHHRSVLTFVGDRQPIRDAVLRLYEAAIAAIDLRNHRGEHPRLGAVDVCPFVPIEGVTLQDCAALAREVGSEVAARFDLPVFLYEDAATSPARRNLEDIRRGEFEGLSTKLQQPEWKPDFGPGAPHPSAGATVIGARMPLIAYNINLATDRLDVAKKIAAAIRMSSGGYRFVKAMGLALEDRGIVQVSMNLTNYEKTPIFRVFETVKREAARYGVSVLESEIVGLVPSGALTQTAEFYLQLEGFRAEQVLESRLRQ